MTDLHNKLQTKQIWSLFHSMAAYYPLEPGLQDRQNVINFLNLFPDFAICDNKDFLSFSDKFHTRMNSQTSMNKLEPQRHLQSRQTFSEWMCIQHNLFNIDRRSNVNFDELSVEKQQEIYDNLMEKGVLFQCTYENVRKRWGPL